MDDYLFYGLDKRVVQSEDLKSGLYIMYLHFDMAK